MNAPQGPRYHVLVVAYNFPPEASMGTQRTLRLVRRLCAGGWQVTVLTGTTGTYSSRSSIDRDLLSRVPSTVRIVRAPALRPFEAVSAMLGKTRSPAAAAGTTAATVMASRAASETSRLGLIKRHLDAMLAIPDHHAGWLVPAAAAGMLASIGRRPDVIYSTAPPWTAQLVSRVLASMLRVPWVADFRDPWARAPWREDRLPIASRIAELLERLIVDRSDRIVFTTATNLEEHRAFYGPATGAKFHLVRNGCDRDDFEGLTPLTRDHRFTLLHAGSLYGARKPTALFSALAALRDRGLIDAQSFCFRQIGRVALGGFDMAAERAQHRLEGIVELVDTQPRREVLREMIGASCLLLLQPATTVSIPGKLFEYFAAGRPILAIAEEGEVAALVRASGRGIAVLPDDRVGLEHAIEALLAGRFNRATPPVVELFDGDLRSDELVSVLESVCHRAPRSRGSAEPARAAGASLPGAHI